MDFDQLLKKDHEKASTLMKKIADSGEGAVKTREQNFEKLKSELQAHTAAEEEILYPALQEHEETRAMALEAIEEHKLVEQLLDELEAMDVSSEEWTAKFTVLKENVEHHVEEEEDEMFKQVRKVLGKENAEELGKRLEEFKSAVH